MYGSDNTWSPVSRLYVQLLAGYALLQKTVSIRDYFKPTVSLPNPNVHVKEKTTSSTFCDVNEKVRSEIERGRKKPGCRGSRESYVKLTPQ